jgi:hypothetical protein
VISSKFMKDEEIWTVGSNKDTWQRFVYSRRRALRRKVRVVKPKILKVELSESIFLIDLRRKHIIISWNI